MLLLLVVADEGTAEGLLLVVVAMLMMVTVPVDVDLVIDLGL